MNLRDYILGRRVELNSPLERQMVERAIRANIKLGFNPFYTGVVGWVRFGRVNLRWATAMWSNGFQPVFSGQLRSEMGSTKMRVRFGAPVYLLLFFGFWYIALSSLMLTALGQYISSDKASGDPLTMVAAASGMMAFPIALHFIFNRSANTHFEQILDLLREVAEFRENAAGR